MFKLIKSMNHGTVVPELVTLNKSTYSDFYAHSAYFYSSNILNTEATPGDQLIFIPIADALRGTSTVTGYFVSDDMIFEVDDTIAGEDDEGTLGGPLYFDNYDNKENSGVISQYVTTPFYGGAYLFNNDDVNTRGKALVLLRIAHEILES